MQKMNFDLSQSQGQCIPTDILPYTIQNPFLPQSDYFSENYIELNKQQKLKQNPPKKRVSKNLIQKNTSKKNQNTKPKKSYLQKSNKQKLVEKNKNCQKRKKIRKRADLDGQHVFKLANLGLKSICRKYSYEKILNLFTKTDEGRKDFFVNMLFQMEIHIKCKDKKLQLYYDIGRLYRQEMAKNVQQHTVKLKNATDKIDKEHEQNALKIYQNAYKVIEAYIQEENPQKAMQLSYGDNIKHINNLKKAKAKLKLRRLRNQYELSSDPMKVNRLQE